MAVPPFRPNSRIKPPIQTLANRNATIKCYEQKRKEIVVNERTACSRCFEDGFFDFFQREGKLNGGEMKISRNIWHITAPPRTGRQEMKTYTDKARPFLLILLLISCLSALAQPVPTADASEIIPDLYEIPSGPGQVCIKYQTYYSSLIDWLNGPLELSQYYSVSYADIDYSQTVTVHSCAGSPAFPGSLHEGKFFLLPGGLISHAAIVDIKRIDGNCPYILTYYILTAPLYKGTCAKDIPPPTNTPNPDTGDPTCKQVPLN